MFTREGRIKNITSQHRKNKIQYFDFYNGLLCGLLIQLYNITNHNTPIFNTHPRKKTRQQQQQQQQKLCLYFIKYV